MVKVIRVVLAIVVMLVSLFTVAAVAAAGFTLLFYSASVHLGYLFVTAPTALIITLVVWYLHCQLVEWAADFGVGMGKGDWK